VSFIIVNRINPPEQGNPQKALQVLEGASQDKARAYPFSGFFWMRAHFRLAEFYRRLGREAEAQAIEDELLQYLKYADSDHVLLRHPGKLREASDWE
jgi:hypothetical protein